MSIKNTVSHDGLVWAGHSCFHQNRDFPAHITERLLSLSPMSESVKA